MARPDAPGSHGDSGAGSPRSGLWQRIDGAAFGLIYGAVTVLALLMAMGAHPSGPLEMAVVLFGSVLTLVIVEQSSARAARVGGRMLLMRGGRIVADGDAAGFAAQDLLTEAYFGDAA